ncbi:MAG: glycosyltransferase family 39 protein [bacterium]|nr:glycosyltransferase family 39 protein [bacterium]
MAKLRQLNTDRDYVPMMVVAIASILSIAAFVHYFNEGVTMLYVDAQSHLLISRRVIDNTTSGTSFGQLGGIWLPLTHVLSLPLVGIDELYHTGAAGSIVSMVAYVLTTLFLYKLVRELSNDRGAGFVAAVLFAFNPNILYMQSTAMTELALYFCTIASVYYLYKVCQEPDRLLYSFLCGLFIALGCWVRYEAWIILGMEFLILIVVYFLAKFRGWKLTAHIFYFPVVAFAGVFGWMAWNTIIFGNPLEFQTGEYAKPALWVAADDPVIGNPVMSFMTYHLATLHNVGPLFYVAIFGALWYVIKNRFSAKSLAPLVLLAIYPAFIGMLYFGQRPLKVPELSNGDMYNIRFALFMMLFVSVFAGYLARKYILAKVLIVGFSALVYAGMVQGGIIALEDPRLDQSTVLRVTQEQGSTWFRECYDGGQVLLESYGSEKFQFDSQVNLGDFIYEGSYQLWEPAMEEPWLYARWVVLRGPATVERARRVAVFTDKTWERWRESSEFRQHYRLMYQNEGLEIWRLKSGPQLATASEYCSAPLIETR